MFKLPHPPHPPASPRRVHLSFSHGHPPPAALTPPPSIQMSLPPPAAPLPPAPLVHLHALLTMEDVRVVDVDPAEAAGIGVKNVGRQPLLVWMAGGVGFRRRGGAPPPAPAAATPAPAIAAPDPAPSRAAANTSAPAGAGGATRVWREAVDAPPRTPGTASPTAPAGRGEAPPPPPRGSRCRRGGWGGGGWRGCSLPPPAPLTLARGAAGGMRWGRHQGGASLPAVGGGPWYKHDRMRSHGAGHHHGSHPPAGG